jgi:hypothetical protein
MLSEGKRPLGRFSLRPVHNIKVYFGDLDVYGSKLWIEFKRVRIGFNEGYF